MSRSVLLVEWKKSSAHHINNMKLYLIGIILISIGKFAIYQRTMFQLMRIIDIFFGTNCLLDTIRFSPGSVIVDITVTTNISDVTDGQLEELQEDIVTAVDDGDFRPYVVDTNSIVVNGKYT